MIKIDIPRVTEINLPRHIANGINRNGKTKNGAESAIALVRP